VKHLVELGNYLMSDESPDNCLGLSDMDGFLTGVVCCPEHIPVLGWLDIALGNIDEVPGTIGAIVTAQYSEIKKRLEDQSGPLAPIFWESPDGGVMAMGWCEGFMEAVKLRPERWEAFSQSDKGARLMMPIMVHMFDDEGNSLFGLEQKDIDEVLLAAAEAIPTSILAIYKNIRIFTRQ
jgi:uncharacterized protein